MEYWKVRYSEMIYTVHYDHLVIRPQEEIPGLIDFCGFFWEKKYLQPERNRRSVLTASSEQVRNPIHSKSVRGWRRYEEQLGLLARMFKDAGYEV